MVPAANPQHKPAPNFAPNFACEETYRDVEKLVHDVVWKFQKRYGGIHEELLSEANYQFQQRYCKAYSGQKEEYGVRWPTWLRQKIWFALLDHHDKHIRQRKRNKQASEVRLNNVQDNRESRWKKLLSELSPDAQFVLKIGVENPLPDVVAASRDGYKTANGTKISAALYEVLGDMGWDEERIVKAFTEIREAIG